MSKKNKSTENKRPTPEEKDRIIQELEKYSCKKN